MPTSRGFGMIDTDKKNSSLLPAGYRGAGILLHVTSLPSRFGIGDLGEAAMAWIDRLSASGQSWWQILPLGPTGLGHSPYDPLSTFAGNLALISPDQLVRDGLLQADDVHPPSFSRNLVTFEAIKHFKAQMLQAAYSRFRAVAVHSLSNLYDDFCRAHADWLEDFARFLAFKHHHNGQFFYHWPTELARHEEQATARLSTELNELIDYAKFCQFLFFRQWHRVKDYARHKGISLLGDLPFFVSHDSAEVWAAPQLFLLDEHRQPLVVAGVPPDYFSATGQLWGNPVYDWEKLKSTGYEWWIRRMRRLFQLVDAVRLDHFRAFAAAWQIPFGAPTAETGQWVPGPGADFLAAARDGLGGLPLVAEDLGLITDDVIELRDQFSLPGMKVLQFAFDGDPENLFLPKNYEANSVAFTGTHDNDTTRGWYSNLNEDGMKSVKQFLGPHIDTLTIADALIKTVWQSQSALAITPLQDLLNLDSSARMNVPGQAAGNWNWRVEEDQLRPERFERLAQLTGDSGRWRRVNGHR